MEHTIALNDARLVQAANGLIPPWQETGYFRLYLSHAPRSTALARALIDHLPDYGIQGYSPLTGGANLARDAAALTTMDGFAVLATRQSNRCRRCQREAEVAVGRGCYLQVVEVTSVADGPLSEAIKLLIPTNHDLPALIANFIANDPAAGRQLATGAIQSLSVCSRPERLVQRVRLLSKIKEPPLEALRSLIAIRTAFAVRNAEAPTELHHLIERWQMRATCRKLARGVVADQENSFASTAKA